MEILQYRTRRKCYNCNDIPNFALKPKYAIQNTSNTEGYFKVQAGGKVCGVGGGGGHKGPYGEIRKGQGGEEGRVDVICAMRRKFDGREGAVGW